MDKVTIPGYSIAQLNELEFSRWGQWYILDNYGNIIGFMFNGNMVCQVVSLRPCSTIEVTLVLAA